MDDERVTGANPSEEKEGSVSNDGRFSEGKATSGNDVLGTLNKNIAAFYLSVLGQFCRILRWMLLFVWRLLRWLVNALFKSIAGLFSLLTKASLWRLIGRILVLIALSVLPLMVFAAISSGLYESVHSEWGHDAADAFGWIWGLGWIVSVVTGIRAWRKRRQSRMSWNPSSETVSATEFDDKGTQF